jgi:hypothetical protein
MFPIAIARKDVEKMGVAVFSPFAVVQVVENLAFTTSAGALVKDSLTMQCKRAIADSPAVSKDCAMLRRSIELELEVGNDASDSTLRIGEDTILKINGEGARSTTATLTSVSLTVMLR